MPAWSPTFEGFRTIFRRPSLSLAEIVWRFSFGGAATLLLGLAFLEYLDTLPVSNTDLFLLRTGHPLLISQAFSHILHGSALRVAIACIVLFSALAVLWIVLASIGRGATLATLLEHITDRASVFHRETAGPESHSDLDSVTKQLATKWTLRSLIGLNFLRATLALAAIAAFIGVIIVAGFASSPQKPDPASVFFMSALFALVIWLLWSSISWFLSTASIFVVQRGQNTFAALSSTADLLRDHFGRIMAVGTWFGIVHLVLFVVATSVVSFPLAFLGVIPAGIVLSAVLLLTLLYFALADMLYIGRLAGYVAILEAPPAPPPPPIPAIQHPALSIPSDSAMVDQDELILSDQPAPNPEDPGNVNPPQQPIKKMPSASC
jgi:hypothetical protein